MEIASVGKREFSRGVGLCALGMALAWGSGTANAAQQDAGEPTPLKLTVKRQLSTADIEGGKLRAQVHAAQGLGERRAEIAREHPNDQNGQGSHGDREGMAFFPGDVSFQGGAVVTEAQSHDIYVNCDASCFGFPARFLNRLGDSDLIHVTDQYVGTRETHRYTVGQGGTLTIPVSGPLGPNDIVTLAYLAGSTFGTGYSHIYHLFFAPGIDVCANAALTVCYSPDNPATFVFCGFHTSVTFPDIGHVLFTVDPFASVAATATVPGCQVSQPSPNGGEVDSQASVLSHELFETITDPDADAWFELNDLALAGNEIADECVQTFFSYAPTVI